MNPGLRVVEITPLEESSSGEFPAGIEERFQVSYFHSGGVMITYRLEKKASGLNMPSWSPSSLKAGQNLTLLITPYWGHGGAFSAFFSTECRLSTFFIPFFYRGGFVWCWGLYNSPYVDIISVA